MAKLNYPDDLKYSEDHEWVRVQGDEAVIGISDFAQDELGDIVYLELPWDEAAKGAIHQFTRFGDIESVKATSELQAPVSGQIVRVNEELRDKPDLVNTDPYGAGWMLAVKLDDPAELDKLMDVDAYQRFLKSGH
jgi:glycine cleavage system H protein